MENQARNAIITLVLSLVLLFTVKTVLADDISGITYSDSPIITASNSIPLGNSPVRQKKAY
jgi:hypothetical protein